VAETAARKLHCGGRSSSLPQDKASKATHGNARGNAGVNAVVDVPPHDNFELIPSQTSGATKNAAADELTWFAVEVGE